MMKQFGLVGFPNAGKSSLFNALTNSEVLAAPYPFATVDAHVGMAAVPDERLVRLAEMSSSADCTPSQIQFCDIGGLVEGAHKGEGLGNQFLSHIREVDALVYVLRNFATDDLPLDIDPAEQLELLEVELSLADHESAQKQLAKRQRQLKGDASLGPQVQLLESAVEILAAGTPIYRSRLGDEDRAGLAENFLLTNKPVLILVNTAEGDVLGDEVAGGGDDAADADAAAGDDAGAAAGDDAADPTLDALRQLLPTAETMSMCVSLEAEIAQLPAGEQAEMLAELGLGDSGLAKFARATQRLLSLRTFFTTGPKQTKAWTFEAGADAQQCAGIIHTDFARGFVRAETIAADLLLECGSWQEAKKQGKVRSEGKDYLPLDGDVMEFRFNV